MVSSHKTKTVKILPRDEAVPNVYCMRNLFKKSALQAYVLLRHFNIFFVYKLHDLIPRLQSMGSTSGVVMESDGAATPSCTF